MGWSAGIAATLLLYLPLYPSLSGPDMAALIDSLPEALIEALDYDQITTGSGYTQATFIGLIGFVLLGIAGIAWGASLGGGHEESGGLELDLAHRVSRTGFVTEALLTLTLKLGILVGFAGGLIMVLNEPSELGLDTGNLWSAMASLFGLVLAIAFVSFAGGISTGQRRLGIASGAAVMVVSYVMNAVSGLVDDLEWLGSLSPYVWAFGGNPLTTGIDVVGLGLLGALALVAGVTSFVTLQRRDVVG
jgi:ABC-2 type transport system permease protein